MGGVVLVFTPGIAAEYKPGKVGDRRTVARVCEGITDVNMTFLLLYCTYMHGDSEWSSSGLCI